MTLNDKTRDVDLELAERLLANPWEQYPKRRTSLELPLEPAGPQTHPVGRTKWYRQTLSPWYLAVPAVNLWIFRDAVSVTAVDALSGFRVFVLNWLGFPGVV